MVYQDCQQRLQTCENKATPKSDCGQQQSFLKEASTIIFMQSFQVLNLVYHIFTDYRFRSRRWGVEGKFCFKFLIGVFPSALLRPKLLLDLINLPTGAYYISNEKVHFNFLYVIIFFKYISWMKENWYAASKRCKYSGMELVSIESKQENDAILGVIGEKLIWIFKFRFVATIVWIFFAGNATEDFWLSGTDLGNEGDFYWASTGHPFGLFSDWMIKMPDNFRNNEHCVQFHSAGGLKWNDNNCNRAYKFICELVQWNRIFYFFCMTASSLEREK